MLLWASGTRDGGRQQCSIGILRGGSCGMGAANTGWKPMLLWASGTRDGGRQQCSIGILPVGRGEVAANTGWKPMLVRHGALITAGESPALLNRERTRSTE
jgi:hypothetical protein